MEGSNNFGAADVVTDIIGKATFKGTAPSSVATGWTVQAIFDGDSLYSASKSATLTYNTTKHSVSLTLKITPTKVSRGGTFSVSGILTDTASDVSLAGKTITFTAESIVIPNAITDASGNYLVKGIIVPSVSGKYNIQAMFSGDALYKSKSSAIKTLTVK